MRAVIRGGYPRLVLSDSGGPDLAFVSGFAKRLERARTPQEKRAMAKLNPDSAAYARVSAEAYMYDHAKVDLAIGNPETPHNFNKAMSNLMWIDLSKHYNVRGCASTVHIRTLIVLGAADPIGIDTAEDLQRLLPRSSMHVIRRAGHFPWAENAMDYDAAIDSFLADPIVSGRSSR